VCKVIAKKLLIHCFTVGSKNSPLRGLFPDIADISRVWKHNFFLENLEQQILKVQF